MKIGVYGLPGYPATAAFASGLAAVGHTVTWRRASLFADDQMERFDAVVVYGLHRGEGRVAEAYAKAGVPVLVVDLAYLRREWTDEYAQSQVGLGRLCWIPPFPCPVDRWTRLGVQPQARGKGTNILIAGQRPADASHGFGAVSYQDWLDRTVATLRASTDRTLVWRPHPRDPDVMPSEPVDRVSRPQMEPIANALRCSHAVVTLNSTVGTEAIVAGLPVICDPIAMYAPWAETDAQAVEDLVPLSEDARMDYLARVGYAQWSNAEMAAGKAAHFILGVLQGEIPVNPAPEMASVGGNISDLLAAKAAATPTVEPKPKAKRAYVRRKKVADAS